MPLKEMERRNTEKLPQGLGEGVLFEGGIACWSTKAFRREDGWMNHLPTRPQLTTSLLAKVISDPPNVTVGLPITTVDALCIPGIAFSAILPATSPTPGIEVGTA
jgi:hypothetical protein